MTEPRTEGGIMRGIMVALSRVPGIRVFRQNVGVGWCGQVQKIARATTVFVNAGDVVVRNARPLHAGLCEGSSDIVGWKSVTITPDMVGRRVALFLAGEVKNPNGGKLREAQRNFLRVVSEAGGLAAEVRSDAEAMAVFADSAVVAEGSGDGDNPKA